MISNCQHLQSERPIKFKPQHGTYMRINKGTPVLSAFLDAS